MNLDRYTFESDVIFIDTLCCAERSFDKMNILNQKVYIEQIKNTLIAWAGSSITEEKPDRSAKL